MGETREVSVVEPGSAWTPWTVLAGYPAVSADVLRETVDGGQAFRWNREADGTWLGLWSHHLVHLRANATGHVEWRAPRASTVTASSLAVYFGTVRDFNALVDALPWRSDPHLARCLAAFPGLRILRQPFGETLLGFLCSATKQIVQIKQMLALLAERHGAEIAVRAGAPGLPATGKKPDRQSGPSPRRLPTWAELARMPEADLRACLLGFRARYIAETAAFLAAHPGWLEETEALPYAAAKERLCELPGVGEKVADCVLLFGAGRLEAFPVDTWILKALARRYGLDDWRPAQVAQFGRAHFGSLAGLAQQYLFAWERQQGRSAPE
ncbi:DNA-3-methyladenine glycosylase family protein [Horticoccus sp. 23ND18S-11]|uniref:DNA-3-methyladenine glycosylase family protein n=1 Tax=Horticoccus sp. 23ND18S-11 TaxID=3391832 RepID=UPI0039C9CD42